MTEVIKVTPSYRLVYSRTMGVCKFIRKKDDKSSYWATGSYCKEVIDRAKNMSIKQLEETAEQFEYN